MLPFVIVGTKQDRYEGKNSEHISGSEAHKLAISSGAYTSLRSSSRLYANSSTTEGNVDKVFNAAIKIGQKGIVRPGHCCTFF